MYIYIYMYKYIYIYTCIYIVIVCVCVSPLEQSSWSSACQVCGPRRRATRRRLEAACGAQSGSAFGTETPGARVFYHRQLLKSIDILYTQMYIYIYTCRERYIYIYIHIQLHLCVYVYIYIYQHEITIVCGLWICMHKICIEKDVVDIFRYDQI